MATEHEIKLIATVDTSQVNGQAGTSSSSGGSRQGSAQAAAQATLATYANKAANSINIAAQNAVKSSELIKHAFQAITFRLKELNDRIHVISYMYKKNQTAVSDTNREFKKLEKSLVNSQHNASRAVQRFITSIDAASAAAQRNARINAMMTPAGGGGGGGGLAALGGKFDIKSAYGMLGRFLGWGGVFTIFNKVSSTLDQTDPEEKTFASAVFKKLPRLAGDVLSFGTTKAARDALKAKKEMDEANAALEETRQFLKSLNAEIKNASFDKYVRQSKEAIKVLSGDGLSQFVDEHRTKLDALKEKYNQINDQIASGKVGRNIDDLKKKMAEIADEISAEQEIYDLASKKMEEAAESAKRLAEETQNLNKQFEKQQQSYQDTLQKEASDERRRGWKSGNIDGIIKDKADINAEFNKAQEAIQAIDKEIARLKEFYSLQNSNEGRKNIIEKINDLIGQRSRLTGQKGQAMSDIDAINNILKSFQDASDALMQKAKELTDSDEFKAWKESLKGLSRSDLEKQLEQLKRQREEDKQNAVQNYQKAAEAKDKPTQDSYKKLGEEAERMMRDADARIAELESAMKGDNTNGNGIKLEDPTDQMTSMGKIGMYMSMNEATLQDPKLEKLNHISLTLVQIERNTSQGTVSRFL